MKALIIISILLLSLGAMAQNPSGSQVFGQCQGCHGARGQGTSGVFPPLAGHIPEVLAAKGGRTYLIHVLLYGLQGSIQVKGQTYSGAMPAFAQLSDAQIAAVLNHVASSWGNKLPAKHKAITAAEVKAQRSKKLSPAQVLAERQKLGLK